MPATDVDLPTHYDSDCGCDICLADDRRAAFFEGLWAELLSEDPRDVQALYEAEQARGTAAA